MAYKSPEKVDVKLKRTTDLKVKENGWSTTEITQKLDKLLLNRRSVDSGQASFEEDSGAMGQEEETTVKSIHPDELLDMAPTLSRELLFNSYESEMFNGGNDYDRKQALPNSAMVLKSRQSVPSVCKFPEGGIHHDISLNSRPKDHNVDQLTIGTNTTTNTVTTHDSSHRTSVGSLFGEREQLTTPLELNILPSLQEPRVNNTDIPTAFAEQQPSFRTTSTVLSHLPPIAGGSGIQQLEQHRPQTSQSNFQTNFTTSLGSYFFTSSLGSNSQQQPMCSVAAPVSTEDNSQNISMSPLMAHMPMTAQPMNRHAQVQVWQNENAHSGHSAGAAGGGRQMSHSSSNSSFKSFISDDCLVKKMSWRILRHIALTLQCKHSSASWKDLVEMYGWDYHRTYLFENRHHQEGIFFSLLQEPEFQDYSLEQLRHDLFNLPRRDILNDLNKMIITPVSQAKTAL